MRISTEIYRSDIVSFNLYYLFRERSSWILVGAVAFVVFVYTSATTDLTNAIAWLVVAISSIVVGLGALLVGFICSLLWVLSTSSEKSGVLGARTYSLSEQGLRESTKFNDAMHKWPGIQSVEIAIFSSA